MSESSDRLQWKKAMKEELDSLKQNDTWEIVPYPLNKNIVDCKWIFTLKNNCSKNLPRYKARVVAKGFSQEYLTVFNETFAPVARITTFRIFRAISNQYNLLIHQMDVTTAFFNGLLKEEIYMQVSEGVKAKENHVCKLKRAI